jgi:two-component system, NtrC family, response regulator GlrR
MGLDDPTTRRPAGTQEPAGRPIEFEVSVVSGPDAGKKVQGRDAVLVGKGSEATFRLNDDQVSRVHLQIQGQPDGIRVRDNASTNGTFLSGAQIQALTVFEEAVLTIGSTVLRVAAVVPGAPAASRAAFGKVIGKSQAIQALYDKLEKAAPTDSTVVLLGETGTGKEVIAHAIHAHSQRRNKPFVVLDCGSMAPNLIESELFGHARGAFSGAVSDRKGAFLEADGGTVFLDEIGELPLELQPRLLRVLESGTVKRLGDDQPRKVDVRIVAATHRDIEAAVKRGTFRQDLWFRLAVVIARVPSLRDRKEDIPLLVRHFVAQLGRGDFELPAGLKKELMEHSWPGNVRELRNVIERALAGGDVEVGGAGDEVRSRVDNLPEDLTALPYKDAKERLVEAFTAQYLSTLLDRCDNNLSQVARTAGIARAYLHELVKKYGLKISGE